MPKFRKKPVVIEARQFTMDPRVQESVAEWCGGNLSLVGGMTIHTLERDHLAAPGDWIIKGVADEFYPCKPDIFAATYEPVDAPARGQTFGWAIEQMRKGASVQREGWNGKGMHIYLEDMLSHVVGAGVAAGTARRYEPCIVMFTAQGKHQPGWLASQADMLATDWRLAEVAPVEPSGPADAPDPRAALEKLAFSQHTTAIPETCDFCTAQREAWAVLGKGAAGMGSHPVTE